MSRLIDRKGAALLGAAGGLFFAYNAVIFAGHGDVFSSDDISVKFEESDEAKVKTNVCDSYTSQRIERDLQVQMNRASDDGLRPPVYQIEVKCNTPRMS